MVRSLNLNNLMISTKNLKPTILKSILPNTLTIYLEELNNVKMKTEDRHVL